MSSVSCVTTVLEFTCITSMYTNYTQQKLYRILLFGYLWRLDQHQRQKQPHTSDVSFTVKSFL